MVPPVMDDLYDFTTRALDGVKELSMEVAIKHQITSLGRYATELFILSDSLKKLRNLDKWYDKKDERSRLHELLTLLELSCSFPQVPNCDRPQKSQYPTLNEVALKEESSKSGDAKVVNRARTTLLDLSGTTFLAMATDRLKKLNYKLNKRMKTQSNSNHETRTLQPEKYDNISQLAYQVLKIHSRCVCVPAAGDSQRHLCSLFLRHAFTEYPGGLEGNHFELLFSEAISGNGDEAEKWQEVRLIVSCPESESFKTTQKRAQFQHSPLNAHLPSTPCTVPNKLELVKGQLCGLIKDYMEYQSPLCLKVEDTTLWRDLHTQTQLTDLTFLPPAPGISLATLLERFTLEREMKIALACILARSTWHFYATDWMKAPWTSETVLFFQQDANPSPDGESNLQHAIFPSKPYVTVHLGDEGPQCPEWSAEDGVIHRYSRIRSLGFLLVEIAIVSRLSVKSDDVMTQSEILRRNTEVGQALKYATQRNLQKRFKDLDPVYWGVVQYCLECFAKFAEANVDCRLSDDEKTRIARLNDRRRLLYENVVYPLERLLSGTGWDKQLHHMDPLKPKQSPSGKAPDPESSTISDPSPKVARISTPGLKTKSADRERSKQWLRSIITLNYQLELDHLGAGSVNTQREASSSNRPVRIAVIDTGYDPEAFSFQSEGRGDRVIGWKDWLNPGATECQDFDGHGTHLVSLIMQIAPTAHIYVARVFENKESLAGSSEKVAQAIKWAQSSCEVDIISMSFGYYRYQTSIDKAIYAAAGSEISPVRLFFAAASNYGANEREMFPARHDSVISVRATSSTGHMLPELNPPVERKDSRTFGTLGLEVPSACLTKEGTSDVYKTGTSVATAVAAGLAALFLEYVRGQAGRDAVTYKKVRDGLRRKEGMEALFESLGESPIRQHGCIYVAPWKLKDKDKEVRWSYFLQAAENAA